MPILRDWENPQVVERNRQPAHVPLGAYPDAETAMTCNRAAEVILHLDGWHMGVGGDDGWMCQVHKEFLIFPGKYQFGLRLRAISAGDDLSSLGRTQIEGVF